MRSLMPYVDSDSNNIGLAQELAVTGLKQPNGLAVDWVTG